VRAGSATDCKIHQNTPTFAPTNATTPTARLNTSQAKRTWRKDEIVCWWGVAERHVRFDVEHWSSVDKVKSIEEHASAAQVNAANSTQRQPYRHLLVS
jgi:hypothetical protein